MQLEKKNKKREQKFEWGEEEGGEGGESKVQNSPKAFGELKTADVY